MAKVPSRAIGEILELLAGGIVVFIGGPGITTDLMTNWGELPER
jgi:hypothetical protein